MGPSAASTTTRAEQRRGVSHDTRTEIIRAARPVAIAGATLGGGALLAHTAGTQATNWRLAGRSKVERATGPVDTNGDGVADSNGEFAVVTGPDGAFTAFGGTPSASRAPPKGGVEQFGETAKTVGLVLGGLIVVGGVVYLATNPKAAGALRKAVGR